MYKIASLDNLGIDALIVQDLDIYTAHGQYKVDPADLWDLNQIFNRGGCRAFQTGFPERY